jgi:hypothetical protein
MSYGDIKLQGEPNCYSSFLGQLLQAYYSLEADFVGPEMQADSGSYENHAFWKTRIKPAYIRAKISRHGKWPAVTLDRYVALCTVLQKLKATTTKLVAVRVAAAPIAVNIAALLPQTFRFY